MKGAVVGVGEQHSEACEMPDGIVAHTAAESRLVCRLVQGSELESQ
jgi:hypothetical protein